MDRPHCIRDQLWRWSTLIGLVISVGRTEMSFSIWQSCCILLTRTITKHVVAWVGCVQPECTIPLGTWNFRSFKPEFLLNGKRPNAPRLISLQGKTNKQTNKQTRTKVSFLSVQSPFIFDSDKTQTDTVIFCARISCLQNSFYKNNKKYLPTFQTIPEP